MKKKLEVCAQMCATCPFRPGSPYAYLAEGLAHSALTTASRICHSTGGNNAINRKTGKKPLVCRGAREVQKEALHSIGFLEDTTDAAWDKAYENMKRRRKR